MKKHIAIIIIQSIIMIFLIVVLFSEHRIGSDHNWFDEPSPNGKYIIHATFPEGISNFGSTEAQFALYDKERKKYFSVVLLMVDNNGKKPDNDNYKLDWYEDFVIRLSVNSWGEKLKRNLQRSSHEEVAALFWVSS